MKKILGLDIGSSSIGWAYVNEAENKDEQSEIVRLGVRIIPMGDELSEFQSGNAISLNAARTDKRGARRLIQRYKLRRSKVQKVLSEMGIFPSKELIHALDTEELYSLRSKAAKEKVQPEELGRVLLLLNQKRGYKSNRKSDNKEENEGDYLSAITCRSKELTEKDITIGQYLLEKFRENPKNPLKGNIFYRSDYLMEFDKIWETQKRFYPELLTDEKRLQLRDRGIFFQRPLKSQKHLVSHCRFEYGHKAISKSAPLFQVFDIWQRLHNLRVTDNEENTEIKISLEQKKMLFSILDERLYLSKTDVLKALKLTPTRRYDVNFPKIDGNKTKARFIEIFEEIQYDTLEVLDFEPLANPDTQPLHKLWHILYSIDDPKALVRSLEKQFGFTTGQANVLAEKVSYGSSYGSLSSRAIRKLLPEMMNGLGYYEACETIGYNHADSITREENENRELKEYVELFRKNSLRNPVVEKVLNQTTHLVNAIIDSPELGRPDEIRVELARELKQSAKERKSTTKNMGENERKNKKYREILKTEFNVPNPTRKDLDRYKLWLETNHISLYSGNLIQKTDLFSNVIEIEHIIPRSLYFDDSFQNKTLCETQLNKDKGNLTAWDYMASKGEEALFSFIQNVKKLEKNISRQKKNYFLMKEEEIPDNFIDRQLRESQYIAREAVNMLRPVCRNVHSTTGMVTDYLRHTWGLTDAMKRINMEKYRQREQTYVEEVNEQQVEKIKGWSKRDDHRHHAMDALVVAFTKPTYINYLNKLSAQGKDVVGLKHSNRRFAPPFENFVSQAENELTKILISFKQNRKATSSSYNKADRKKLQIPRGPLHEETVYGEILYPADKPVKLSVRFNDADKIINPIHKQLVKERLQEFGNDPRKAFKELKKNPIYLDKEKNTVLTEVEVYEKRYTIRKSINTNFSQADKIVDKMVKEAVQQRLKEFDNKPDKAFADLENNPIWLNGDKKTEIKTVTILAHVSKAEKINRGYVVLGNNHHMGIYENEEGKRDFHLVSQWEATARAVQGMDVIQTSHAEKGSLVCTLQINDMFIIDPDHALEGMVITDPENYSLVSKYLYRVQKLTMCGNSPNMMFRHHLATKIDDKNDEYLFQSLSWLKGLKKLQVNRLGQLTKSTEL